MTSTTDAPEFSVRPASLLLFVLIAFGLSDFWSAVRPWFEGLPTGSSTVGFNLVLGAITWLCLHMEGSSPARLGSRASHLIAGITAVAAVVLLANLLGLLLAALLGTSSGVSHLWGERDIGAWIRSIVLQFLIVGLIEELAFRGYLQNWLIQRFGSESRAGIAAAILIGGLAFSLWHPALSDYFSGAWLEQLPMLGLLWFSGIGFGLIYYFSGNLYLAAGLHGLGNTWPFAFSMSNWSPLILGLFWTLMAGLYLAAIITCRRMDNGGRQATT